MELENVSIVTLLNSIDPNKQIQSLLILLQQSIDGKDVQSYLSTIIQSVLIKSNHKEVKKLCYELIKGCTINSKDDWSFIEKSLIIDLKEIDTSLVSIKSIISIYSGQTDKFIQFLIKYEKEIEECYDKFNNIQIEILKIYEILIKVTRYSFKIFDGIELIGKMILKSIKDINDEISSHGFLILKEAICGDIVKYYNEIQLPIPLNKMNMKWIEYIIPYYHLLFERLKKMDIYNRRNGIKVMTFLSLKNNEMKCLELMKPMLNSIDIETVLESVNCILILKDSNDYSVNALMNILERDTLMKQDIMKDIICCLDSIRDKYTICSKLIEHISSIQDIQNRMIILIGIYKTLIKTSFFQRMKSIKNGTSSRFSKESDIEMIKNESFMDHIFKSPRDEFEDQLRCEMLYCLSREFLLLKPDQDHHESLQAWIQVGIEISQIGVAAFLWKPSPNLNSCLSEITKILTKLSIYPDKRIQEILGDLLNNYSQIQSEYSQLLCLSLLSNYLDINQFKDTCEIIFSYIYQKLKVNKDFLYCLSMACLKYPIKLKENQELLKNEKYKESFQSDHPIFKKYLTDSDIFIIKNYISSRQYFNQMIQKEKGIELKQDVKSLTKMISQPSDPFMVTASYRLFQDLHKVIVYIKIQNTSTIDMYQTSIELSTKGPFFLFDRNVQIIELIGDFPAGNIIEFEREYILNRFKYSEFHITIHSSSMKLLENDLIQDSQSESYSIRCIPFELKPFHLLLPTKKLLHEDFLSLWESFTFSFHQFTIFSSKLDKKSAIDIVMRSTPFTPVYHKIISFHNSIKLCFATKTLFNDFILLMIYCTDYNKVNVCNWEFRASSETVLNTLKNHQKWFREMTNGMTILQQGSIEMENYNLFNHVKDDLKLSISSSFNIQNDSFIYFKKFKDLNKN